MHVCLHNYIVTRAELSGDNNGKDIYFPDAKQHHFNTSILIPASFIHQQSVTTGTSYRVHQMHNM